MFCICRKMILKLIQSTNQNEWIFFHVCIWWKMSVPFTNLHILQFIIKIYNRIKESIQGYSLDRYQILGKAMNKKFRRGYKSIFNMRTTKREKKHIDRAHVHHSINENENTSFRFYQQQHQQLEQQL